MPTSSRFAVAVHVLTALALNGGIAMSSDALAASVNTNPAFLRQVLGRLRRAGLVKTKLGSGGGTTLARPAHRISLEQVHAATEDTPLIGLHHSKPSARCAVGRNIIPLLEDVVRRADRAVAGELARSSVADIAAGVCRRG